MTTSDRTPHRRPRSERAEATRTALVDLAAERFATHGYVQTSMRDIERDGPVTMAAIYGHFKNKAELLIEAIHLRIKRDLEDQPAGSRRAGVVQRLTDAARTYPERRQLRALLLQAAAASLTDEDTRNGARAAQQAHIDAWVAGYEANRARNGLDPDLDVRTVVLYTWAVELGLGMLEAFAMEPDPEAWADIQRRLARSLLADGEQRAIGNQANDDLAS